MNPNALLFYEIFQDPLTYQLTTAHLYCIHLKIHLMLNMYDTIWSYNPQFTLNLYNMYDSIYMKTCIFSHC